MRLGDWFACARFCLGLPFFLRRPLTLEEALATVRRRLERREQDFLELARRCIYARPASPYRALLDLAGCAYQDLEELVRREGLEGALGTLYSQGVYLTTDEMRGGTVKRGSSSFQLQPDQLLNAGVVELGTRREGAGRRSLLRTNLGWLRENSINHYLSYQARGGLCWRLADWGSPGSVGSLLRFALFDRRPIQWFVQVDPAGPGLHSRYRWSIRALLFLSAVAGRPLPRPVHVPPLDPLPVARWMAHVLQRGETPLLATYPSAAAQLCRMAIEHGIDIRGAQVTVGGEPVTRARLAEIERAGVIAVPHYGSTEVGSIGFGCLIPMESDDVHFMNDRLAMIQPSLTAPSSDLPPHALLLTSLRPTTRFLLLNASLGDQAQVVRRSCGCSLEELGWSTHLHTIRSFEKLTAGGMTLLDADVVRVLEEVLPHHFGGGPLDYQIIEEEAEDGRPGLRLLVNPALGPLDDGALLDVFLAAIGEGSGAERIAELQWRQAGVLQVERQVPRTSPSGKVLHLHRETSGHNQVVRQTAP